MLTRDDVLDIIGERLERGRVMPCVPSGAGPRLPPGLEPECRGRLFLSEHDIKKRLTAQELRIPRDAIISPLATDWLTLRRIKIIRE